MTDTTSVAPRRKHPLASFCWTVALFGAIAAGLFGYSTIHAAQSAPQEASAAAMACLIAIVPYVLARAIDELTQHPI